MKFKEYCTDIEKQTNYDTMKHIDTVRMFIHRLVSELLERMNSHDNSKLNDPEVGVFTEYTPKLKNCTYGSDEYKRFLKAMKPALDHHYKANRHHPEHFRNGIDDMTFIDLIEMLCDWKAATMRHDNGDIQKSIEINKDRFGISDQLVKILQNTIKEIE